MCDLVITGVTATPPAAGGTTGYATITFTTSAAFVFFTVTGPVNQNYGFVSTTPGAVYAQNLPAGTYSYLLYLPGDSTCSATGSFTIAPAPPLVPGCTDPDADNPTPGATQEDGSCVYTPPALAPLFVVPLLQALRFVVRTSAAPASFDTQLFCEQPRPGQQLRPYYYQLVQYDDVVRVQVLTSYTAVAATIYQHGGAAVGAAIPLQQVLTLEGSSAPLNVTLSDNGNGFTKLAATAGGGAEQIATEIGKISTVFRNELGEDQAKNINLIGSAINELGAAGAATAPFLADVAQRTGSVAANVRLGLSDVLAYAAVLQETGFNAETSGTALNRLFNTLSTRRNEAFNIAKLADSNLTLKDFTHLINTDFQGALTLFLRGLREGGTTTTRFNDLLGTLKLQSGEAKNVITTLAKNVELLTEKQAIASDQLERGTSLAAEAAIKNNNLAGSWAKLKNDVSNFFDSGAGGASLKYFIDFTRASLNFKEGFGAIPRLLGLAKPPIDDLGKSLADNALAARKAADETEHLMARFESLRAITNPTVQQQQQLREAVLALKDKLGESAVVLNEQTGQFDLNTAAVTKNYKAQRQGYLDNAVALAKRLQDLEAERAQSLALSLALKEEADRKEALVRANTTLKAGSLAPLDYDVKQRAKTPTNYDANEGAVKPEILSAYTQYVDLSKQAAAADDKATIAVKKRDEVLTQLERLGLDSSAALALLAQSTKDDTAADDKDIDTKKKKKQAIADVAKEEYELQKQRLQARITDLDRQADNPANTEAIRTEAARKAVQVRAQLAELERVEGGREAAKANKDKIDGDKATAVVRVRLLEAYQAQIEKDTRDGDAKVIAIRNQFLNALAELDKITLEAEIADLDRTAQDENKSYDERQKAALDASARRIEIILLESDIKRRAARGDAAELARIQAEEDSRKTAELQKLRSPDADKANTDLDKQYTSEQLKLEKSLGGKLESVRSYEQVRYDLETGYLEKRLENLQKDSTKQKEAADLELEIEQRKNKQKLDDEQKTAELVKKIEEDVINYGQQLASAYFNFKGAQLDAELQRENDAYDEQITAAGNNAALKQQIEEKHQKELKRLAYEKAVNDRKAALFSIVINTAAGVARALSDYPLPYALIPAAAAVVIGGLEAAAVLAQPLPAYFKGRQDGPAEFAQLGERGPELVGKPGSLRLVTKPSVGYLEAGDRVYTAPETRQLLAQNELVEGRIVQRQYQNDLHEQTGRLRNSSLQREQAQQRAMQQSNHEVLTELREVRKAIQEQEYYRLNEQEDLVRRSHRENGWQDMVNRRYKGKR